MDACSHGVALLNKLNQITKMPGRPLSISNCFIQGKKVVNVDQIAGFLEAYMNSIRPRIGEERWKDLIELQKDPLIIVDNLKHHDRAQMTVFFKSLQKVIPSLKRKVAQSIEQPLTDKLPDKNLSTVAVPRATPTMTPRGGNKNVIPELHSVTKDASKKRVSGSNG